MQIDIFSQPPLIQTHARENNAESEQHLYNHRKHFEGDCRKLYNLLMAGNVLTVYSSLVEHKISSLPRRVADCRVFGVKISDEQMPGTRIKRWWCSESDKEYNLEFMKLKKDSFQQREV